MHFEIYLFVSLSIHRIDEGYASISFSIQDKKNEFNSKSFSFLYICIYLVFRLWFAVVYIDLYNIQYIQGIKWSDRRYFSNFWIGSKINTYTFSWIQYKSELSSFLTYKNSDLNCFPNFISLFFTWFLSSVKKLA